MTNAPAAAPTGIIDPTGYSHVRLSVSDIAVSRQFYVTLLGRDPARDFSAAIEEPGIRDDPDRLFGGCTFVVGHGQVLGLRPVAAPDDRFDPTRIGLDHLSLAVSSIEDLHAAVDRLDAAGVVHGEVVMLDDFRVAILSIQDPDDINLELAVRF